ncbi:MAG: hypothetical protein HXK67_04505 [Clostridiales bacterium]|nr:hypothetical protein [Clostridiales bacterium]MBF0986416.1 hypothetical protein [Clostridiales bacterium]
MKEMENIEVYAFVGPSGTGKSYRAQMVAGAYNIKFIIDDGLLVKENAIVAGQSAKKAPTKIETIKKALFNDANQKAEMQEAIIKLNPKSILILGTSDKMVKTIAENLGLPPIKKTIYITDVATEEEIENARRIRTTEGKHVIPVPTFELKKDFSGYLLDPLQIFKSQGLNGNPYIAEKSIIRPTFNYIGNFTISDNVFKQIIEVQAKDIKSISKIIRIRVNKSEEGPNVYIEVEIVYGFNIITELKKFKERCIRDIERQTRMNVTEFKIVAKKISLPVIGELPNIEDITKEVD